MDKSEIIYLVATLKVKDGHTDDLVSAIQKIIPLVKSEPGCIAYDLHRDRNDPSSLVMLETWESRKALDLHISSAPFKSLEPTLKDSLAEPLSLLFLERM